nr:magnesium transporter [Raoultella sp. NCTC 9187]
MDSCLFRVKPDDERQQVVAELGERGLNLVPVVEKGELVGCLMEKEIAHLLEDEVTEDAHLQGATLPLEKPYLEISRGRCGRSVRSGCCCCSSPKPTPAALSSTLKRRWSRPLRWPSLSRC